MSSCEAECGWSRLDFPHREGVKVSLGFRRGRSARLYRHLPQPLRVPGRNSDTRRPCRDSCGIAHAWLRACGQGGPTQPPVSARDGLCPRPHRPENAADNICHMCARQQEIGHKSLFPFGILLHRNKNWATVGAREFRAGIGIGRIVDDTAGHRSRACHCATQHAPALAGYTDGETPAARREGN